MSIDVRQGDKYTLQQQMVWSDGRAIDLSQYSSITFKAVKDGDSTAIITKTCSVIDSDDGMVTVSFEDGDLDTVGMYMVVWVLLNSINDDQMTIPSQGKQWMHIQSSVYE